MGRNETVNETKQTNKQTTSGIVDIWWIEYIYANIIRFFFFFIFQS
jgi:hypothetical protein